MWRRGAFVEVVADALVLSEDGNVATVVRARHVSSDRPSRMMSVHLDADDPAPRRPQLRGALDAFAPVESIVDVVAGDCNEDTIATDLGRICDERDFRDALTELGRLEPTHPYARPSDDYAPLARLDHVLVRGAEPQRGSVVDSDVWGVETPGERLGEHLRRTGSDHLPIVVTVTN